MISPFQVAFEIPGLDSVDAIDGLDGYVDEEARIMKAKMVKEVEFAVYALPCRLEAYTSITEPRGTKRPKANIHHTHCKVAGLLMGRRKCVKFCI